MYKPNRWPGLR